MCVFLRYLLFFSVSYLFYASQEPGLNWGGVGDEGELGVFTRRCTFILQLQRAFLEMPFVSS